MTIRLSTGLVNSLAAYNNIKGALDGCVIDIYSGTQPANADTAAAGTLLVTLSKSAGSYTCPVAATGSFTITGATGGTVDTVKLAVGGGTAFDILGAAVSASVGDVNATATAVALQLNRNPQNIFVIASSTGASGVVTLTAVNGLGALVNGWVVTTTQTTVTVGSLVNMGSGVAGVTHVNGLTFDPPTATGVIAKNTTETWQGTAGASGTAGWFRIALDTNSAARAAASTTLIRLDGALATSGGDINLGSLTVASGAPFILSAFTITEPQT